MSFDERLRIGAWIVIAFASAGASGCSSGGETAPPGEAPAPLCPATTGAGVVHEGDVAASETWRAEDGPHVVRGAVVVRAGAELRIAPCVEVRFEKDASLDLGTSLGNEPARLVAAGEEARPIRFVPATRDAWSSLAVFAPSRAELRYVTLEGGGSDDFRDGATVYVQGASVAPATPELLVDHVTVRGSRGSAVRLTRAAAFDAASKKLDVTGTQAMGGGYPLVVGEHTLSSLPDGSYTGNAVDEILVLEDGANGQIGLQLDATLRARSVPYRIGGAPGESLQVGGSGEGGLATLTIEPGVELRFSPEGRLHVLADPDRPRGALRVLGTEAAPVVMTATTAKRAPGGWVGLWFDAPIADTNLVEHARIEYAGGSCACTMTSCNVLQSYDAAIVLTGAPPNVFLRSSTIAHSAGHGVLRSWLDAASLDFTPTNAFEDLAGCRQTMPELSDRHCPDPALACE